MEDIIMMKNKIVKKLDEIFENKNKTEVRQEQYQRIEKETQVKIPEELRYIIENYDGIFINDDIGIQGIEISPFAHHGYEVVNAFLGVNKNENIYTVYQIVKDEIPFHGIPIAEMDGGNYILLNADDKIYVWLHDEEPGKDCYLLANDFEDFIMRFEKLPVEEENKECHIIAEYSDDFWD